MSNFTPITMLDFSIFDSESSPDWKDALYPSIPVPSACDAKELTFHIYHLALKIYQEKPGLVRSLTHPLITKEEWLMKMLGLCHKPIIKDGVMHIMVKGLGRFDGNQDQLAELLVTRLLSGAPAGTILTKALSTQDHLGKHSLIESQVYYENGELLTVPNSTRDRTFL